ncbi:hypothetical protein MJN51_37395, partial [Salmonella enterica subsp. enterica serovar Kentucky]|nr:hypothetical protein [Salmonella enterica subsp. enterica serovar Kentucky]
MNIPRYLGRKLDDSLPDFVTFVLKRHYLCKILCGILTRVTLTRFNFCHYPIASRLLVPLTGDFI